MRPPEEVKAELVRQWLKKAEEGLNAAKVLLSYGQSFLSAVGFHAQQAAEKYLKAFLTFRQTEFPKTHDIGELLALIARTDAGLAASLRPAVLLTPYGVEIRYPSDAPELRHQAEEAVRLAGVVRDAILATLDNPAGG
jgi:HEPN domain-containing protein